jgi:hypothetical protein
MGGYTVGVAGQTVNLLVSASGGSTPSLPTVLKYVGIVDVPQQEVQLFVK